MERIIWTVRCLLQLAGGDVDFSTLLCRAPVQCHPSLENLEYTRNPASMVEID